MNVKKEIEDHSSNLNKPILYWLFKYYHLQSQWDFVAKCIHQRYGNFSYQTYRIWYPTQEGLILYNNRYLLQKYEN
jgi:23S rRNA A2030 N6-methylase RlmJ